MKYLKMISLAALAAMALMAVAAGSASATTIGVTGVAQTKSVTITSSIAAGGSALLKSTSGFSENTCTQSTVSGATSSPFTGTTVTGGVSTLSFSNCTNPVTVHKGGTLHISHTSGTNGTLTSSGAEVTSWSTAIGEYVNCKTGAGTHLGTLTGVKHGEAIMHINAVLNCGFWLPSAQWQGTYTVTTQGIGVEA